MTRSTINPNTIAKSRKAMSVIGCLNSSTLEQLDALVMGLGSLCQACFFDSETLISLSNANHYLPFGDDKSQPLD